MEGNSVHPIVRMSEDKLNENRIDNSFYRGKVFIDQCCSTIKLSERIATEAQGLLCNAVVIVEKQKKDLNQTDYHSDDEVEDEVTTLA